MSLIRLTNGPMCCRVAPQLGGAIVELSHAGRPVLRPATGARDVLASASFPLVPFANRIAGGRFRFGAREIVLASDPAAAPHAHHGHGWRRAWTVAECDGTTLTLSMDYPGGDWPWPYRAWQRFALGPDGLAIELALENCHPTEAMPAGLGVHPYFVRHPDSRVTATAARMWHNDPTGLAIAPGPSGIFRGQAVALGTLAGLDNYFVSPDPRIVIGGDAMEVILTADAAGFHLYCPEGADFFCVEPVSHAPNSFGRGDWDQGDILAPGARSTRHYRFALSDPAGR